MGLFGLWTIVITAISAVMGYFFGLNSKTKNDSNYENETRLHLTAWNQYVTALRELAVIRIALSSSSATSSSIATSIFNNALDASKVLGESIGKHFGNVASETITSILIDQVSKIDTVFVHTTQGTDATVSVKNLYANGKRLAEYLSNITSLFLYNETATIIKSLLDCIIRITVDSNKTGLAYETTNTDALIIQTTLISAYFSQFLYKYDLLKRYVSLI